MLTPGIGIILSGTKNRVRARILIGVFIALSHGLESLQAATNVVNSLADSGAGSLRQAILAANPDDTIQVTAQGTLLLSSGILAVNKNLTIAGPGVNRFVIDAQQLSYHFSVSNNATVILSDLTLTNGYNNVNSSEGEGGAVRNLGNLTMIRCAVLDCSSEFGSGGGLYNAGTLTLQHCMIWGNIALDGGGISNLRGSSVLHIDSCTIIDNAAGFGNGGAFVNSGIVFATNSTISGNFAAFDGGGIANFGFLDLQSCTVVSNEIVFGFDGVGGGCFNYQQGELSSRNSIFAGNSAEHEGHDIFGTFTSEGNNLIQNSSGWTAEGNTTGNLIGISPQLGPLQTKSGLVPTHALLEGSPAIDQGDSGLTVDQRGFSRPYDSPHILNAADGSDIGAFEFRPAVFVPLEAESAVLTAPVAIASDPLASGGQYVSSPNGSGAVLFNVNIPEPDDYVVWCRVLATDFSADSFFVSADGGPELIYDAAENIPSSRWQWTRGIGRNAGEPVNLNPRTFSFSKTNHNLVFRAREANTKLDRILVTNDTNFVPVIAFEAESAALNSPAAIFSDSFASRAQYVSSSVAEQGAISFSFGIPATNQYYVWCRVLAPSLNADSFYVSMDGGSEFIYDVAEGKQSPFWQWSRMIARTNGQIDSMPKTFSLGQAQHALVFRTREANTKLDKILITNDPTLNPAPVLERYPDGVLEMTFFDEAGRTNRIQATATFTPTTWSDVVTRVADWNGFFIFEDPTTQTSRFYRTVAP